MNISDDEHFDEIRAEPLIDTDVNNNFDSEIARGGINIVEPLLETNETSVQSSLLSEPGMMIEPQQVDTCNVGVPTNVELDPTVVDDIAANAVEDAPDDFDAEMQRKIEEMIDSVMNCAKEELDWQQDKNDEDHIESREEPTVESSFRYEISQPNEAPLPPPRRKSNVEENSNKAPDTATTESMPMIVESQIEEIIATAERIVASQQEAAREDDATPQVRFAPEASIAVSSVHLPEQDVQELKVAIDTITKDDNQQDDSISSQFPSHLHLSSLEIDRLSVHSLQAGRIVASEIDSNTIVTNEFECKTSNNNLPSTISMEFPPGFIEEIVERVRCAERAETQVSTLTESNQQSKETSTPESQVSPSQGPEQPPARPPLPTQFGHSDFSSAVPPTFFELRDFSEEETAHQQMQHRRRKHQTKRKESTSEEDFQRDHRNRNRSGTSNDQSVLNLGGQFARACGNAIRESGGHLMEILRASSKDENKRDLHVALIILIIIVAGLVLMGMGSDKSVHHHHWDFFNPPDNHGRT